MMFSKNSSSLTASCLGGEVKVAASNLAQFLQRLNIFSYISIRRSEQNNAVVWIDSTESQTILALVYGMYMD